MESSKHVTSHKYEALSKELEDLQNQSINKQKDLEKQLRVAHERNRSLEEDLDDVQAELSSLDRQQKRLLAEVEGKHVTLQKTIQDLRNDLVNKSLALHSTQGQVSKRETEIAELESEVLQLKSQSGDVGELETIKRDLSEQVTHMRRLEVANREQTVELRHLRQVHKAVEIVEEEKRALQTKVDFMNDLQNELMESQFKRQILEEEKQSWTTYLKNASPTGDLEFTSPEALARTFAQEKLERVSLMDRLGKIQPELSEKEAIISSLEAERNEMRVEVERLKANGGGDTRAKSRLERQKALAMKEVDYLRDQLKTFESEEVAGEIQTESEAQTRKGVAELESLVLAYRSELHAMHDELSRREHSMPVPESHPLKRSREEEPDECLGQLSRRNRKLQDDLETLQKSCSLLQSDLAATKSQLSSLRSTSSTRILSLRSNPTDDFQTLKYSTIASLREENIALMSQLEGATHHTKVVPASSLHNARLEIAELVRTIKEKDKFVLRLKQVYSRTTLDFREAVASLLGWKMDPMPQGRFRLTSLYNPATLDGEDSEGGNSLIFDGTNGAFKTSAGPESDFAIEIRPLIRFWVEERKWIPGFLSALTLEFYERTTRARGI